MIKKFASFATPILDFPLMRLAFFIFVVVSINACATKPKIFSLVYASKTSELFYPPPPQKARFEYIGDLVGEVNFIEEGDRGDSFWQTLLTGLTGIEREKDQRLMLRPVNGLTLKNANVLVADAGHQAIYLYDVNLNRLNIWKKITPSEAFINPVGLAHGPNDSILITDAGHAEIFAFNSSGQLLARFGKGILTRPTGIVYHAQSDRIFVSDTKKHQIAVFSGDGQYMDSLGNRGLKEDELSFNFPTFLALHDNTLYVTDTMNARIMSIDIEGKLLSVMGTRGYKLGELNRPKGVALDSQGHIYVVESYFDHLLVFGQDGQFLLPIGGTGNRGGQFYLPSGVWIDDQDRIYVADMANGRVSIFQYIGEETE